MNNGDLISRSSIIEKIRDLIVNKSSTPADILQAIIEEPTAYDIDMVLSTVENSKKEIKPVKEYVYGSLGQANDELYNKTVDIILEIIEGGNCNVGT